jgi:hypothetical protein
VAEQERGESDRPQTRDRRGEVGVQSTERVARGEKHDEAKPRHQQLEDEEVPRRRRRDERWADKGG